MDRRSRTSVIVAALLVAACGSSAPSGGLSTPPTASPSASPPAETAPPIAAGPAWTAIRDAIDPNGHVTKDTALAAFALASGVDMPGVTPPAGDPGTIASGTMALRWLVSYWDALTADQQAAAIAVLPELAGLGRAAGVPGTARLAVARAPADGAAPAAKVAQYRPDAFYTQLAKVEVADIQTHLPKDAPTFNLTIDAHVGLTQKATSGMQTAIYDAKGGSKGAAAKCVITVSWLGDAQTDVDVESEMAHEAWHCFEGLVLGTARYETDNPASWIVEGEASWVEGTLVPKAALPEQNWYEYLANPELPLFQRTYDGVGYFGHFGDIGVDGWTKLIPVLTAETNAEAFNAGGANVDPFLDTWASSLLNDGGRGPAWDMVGPALPSTTPVPSAIGVPNDASQQLSAPAYGNRIVMLSETPDVLQTTFTGRVRLSDASGLDYLADDSDGTFCMLPSGCACPGASTDEPPMLTLNGAGVVVAVTGGPKGASGTLTGTKLDDYCHKGITGTWDGSARVNLGGVINDFTMTVVQKGAAFKGTTEISGPNCAHHGDVVGTVSGSDISMQWSGPGLQDVVFEGRVSGATMSGTFTAVSCPPASLNIDGTWSATKSKP
jgi:hypothetical protein